MKKRALIGFIAVIFLLIVAVLPISAALPEASDEFYVNDMADVIDAETENYIVENAVKLYSETGAQIVVATVNFTDGIEIENYAMQLFNEWGIGASDVDNGLLILLVIGQEDYWVTPGEGLEDVFSGGKLKVILDKYLESDFAKADYDAGVRKTFDAVAEELELYYSREDSPKSENIASVYKTTDSFSVFNIFGSILNSIIVIALILIFIFLIIKIFGDDDDHHDDHHGGGGRRKRIVIHPPIGGSFGRGFMGGLGGSIGREIGRNIGRGFGSGPHSRPHSGGFGGSRGGFSGGHRGGGGSTRGGGAGRR